MFCPKCGTQVEDGAAFCPTCGAKLADTAGQETPETPSEPTPPEREPIYEVTGPARLEGMPRVKDMIKNVSFKSWILLAVVLVVAVLFASAGIRMLLLVLLVYAVVCYLTLHQYWTAAGFGHEFSVQLPEGKTDEEWVQAILETFEYPEKIKKTACADGGIEVKFTEGAVAFGEAYSVKVSVQDGVLKVSAGEQETPTNCLAASYAANELAQALNYFANDIVLPADFMLEQKHAHKDSLGKLKGTGNKLYAVVVAVVMVGCAVWFYSATNDASMGIKDVYIEEASTEITMGEALDSFYTNGKWSNYKEKGVQYVVYKARQEKYDIDIKIIFTTDGDTYTLVDSEINGEQEGAYGASALIAAAYGDGTSKILLASSYADNWTAWDEAFSVAQEESERQEAAENAAASENIAEPEYTIAPDYEEPSYNEAPVGDYAGDYGTHDYVYDDAPYSDKEFANGMLNYRYYYDDNNVIVPYSADAWAVVVLADYTLKSGPGVDYDDVVWVKEGDKLLGHYCDGDWVFVANGDFTLYGWIPEPYQEFDWSTVQ